MKIVNKKLTLDEFKKYIRGKEFYPNMPYRLVLHHTWKPTEKDWNGQKTVDALKKYYEGLGWTSAPHIFVAPDGIWLFTDMKTQGIHANEGNYRSIGIEVVGDYDGAKWSGKIKEQAVGVIKALMAELNITDENILRHNDFNKAKTCPGKMITKKWLLEQINKDKATTPIPEPQKPVVEAPVASSEVLEDIAQVIAKEVPPTKTELWQDAFTEIFALIKRLINLIK